MSLHTMRSRSLGRVLAKAGILLAVVVCLQCSPAPALSSVHANLTDSAGSGATGDAPTLVEQAELTRLYESAGRASIWLDAAGLPGGSARDALAILDGAADHGLAPADYGSVRLRALAESIVNTQPARAEDASSFDRALSASMLRFLHDLGRGRVNPQTVGLRLNAPPERQDVVMLLGGAIESDRIGMIAEEVAPPNPQYPALREMLARYRVLAKDPSLASLPVPGAAIHPGEYYAGLGLLQRRLVAFGDLPGESAAPVEGAAYDGELVEGVKTFQTRHGLEPDGVIGRATWSALSAPLTWRVRQIELALERLRWLPDLRGDRFIALNIPMFHVWAWDSVSPGAKPRISMRAIVGRAVHTPTPVFSKVMHAVIFRPYWNIPASILRNEILPAVAREADFLQREEMEIVRGAGDDAEPVAATEENIALLRQGVLRLRQRPGPENALGLIKFIFPNEENVYLHDTPGKRLFNRARRDFSHGCVRLADPVALAEWVLEDEPEWTREEILAAMADTRNVSRLVGLKRPIQVILFYTTAVVMPEDGTIHFAEDIYGHDTTLDKALSRWPVS